MARPVDPQKRSAILQAARTAFVRDGYDDAKMSDIAELAKVAPGTLYRYFSSKEALSTALTDDFFERCLAVVKETLPRISEPGGIELHVDAVIEIAKSERAILVMARSEALQKTPSADDSRLKFLNWTAAIYEDLMERGEIRRYEPRAFSHIIGAMVHSVILGGVVFELLPLEVLRSTLFEMLNNVLFDETMRQKLVSTNKPAR